MSKKSTIIKNKDKTVKSINNNIRSSVRKLNPILKGIVGKKVDIAIRDLQFSEKRITKDIRKTINSAVENAENNLSKFTNNEVNLNIKEVKKPETNAYLVAENIAQQLVKRISYRRAMKRAMQSCLRLGAKGIKVSISGRLGGNEIARTEWLRDGSIPSHTLRADIDYAEAEALTTYGIIGIKVWIYKGEVFAREFSQETNKITPREGKE